ncbi:MAG: glycosyl transferase family 36, partial [Rhodanobacter sp.]
MSRPTHFETVTRITPLPILSNGKLSTMLSDSGSGFVRWHGLAVTRWREDPVTDPWGSFLLLRDNDNGSVWGVTPQPLGVTDPQDAVEHDPGRITFTRRHDGLDGRLEVAVAPTADIELRRLSLRNHADRNRRLSLTTYAELVLGPVGDDNAHPAFSKMFVQTEWDGEHQLLLANRRRRSDSQAQVWAAQALQVEGAARTDITHETDRAHFLGRGRTLRNAAAMQAGATLAGTAGCVLDPVFSLRHEFTLAPGESIQLLLWTQLADTRDGALALVAQLQNHAAAAQLFAEAEQHAAAERKRLGIDAAQVERFAHWQHALLISDASQRASA